MLNPRPCSRSPGETRLAARLSFATQASAGQLQFLQELPWLCRIYIFTYIYVVRNGIYIYIYIYIWDLHRHGATWYRGCGFAAGFGVCGRYTRIAGTPGLEFRKNTVPLK